MERKNKKRRKKRKGKRPTKNVARNRRSIRGLVNLLEKASIVGIWFILSYLIIYYSKFISLSTVLSWYFYLSFHPSAFLPVILIFDWMALCVAMIHGGHGLDSKDLGPNPDLCWQPLVKVFVSAHLLVCLVCQSNRICMLCAKALGRHTCTDQSPHVIMASWIRCKPISPKCTACKAVMVVIWLVDLIY